MRLLRALPPMMIAATLLGCGGGEPSAPAAPAPLATQEVGPAPDASVDLSADAVGRTSDSAALAGQLPDDFPADVPLPAGCSLVDFGADEGGRFVLLHCPGRAEAVADALAHRLEQVDFAVSRPRPASLTARRGTLTLDLAVEPAGAATALRIGYGAA